MSTGEKVAYAVCVIITLYVYPFVFGADFVVIALICIVPYFPPLMVFCIPIFFILEPIFG